MAGLSTSQPAAFRYSTPCDAAQVRGAVQKVLDFLTGQGWNREQARSFGLALTEACNNAVEHASPAGQRLPIAIEAISDVTQVEFRIHDHTPGFDWPARIDLPTPESESGRGLYLIRSLVDSAGYFRGEGENILILRKLRPPGQKVPSAPTDDSARVITGMVEELSSCYESLAAIFRYGAELGQSGHLDEFARRLFADLLPIINADWFVLRLAQGEPGRVTLFAASTPNLSLEPLALDPGQSLESKAAASRQTVWFGPARRSVRPEPLLRAHPDSAGMVLPIVLADELVGTLALGRRTATHADSPFTAANVNVATTFADFFAIQVAHARHQEEEVRRRLVTHELDIARNIQRSLLPAALPQLPGLTLAAFCRSAQAVGGDFYDVIPLDADSALLVIADVMGKGVPAALFAAILRAVVRAAPELARQPAALLTRVNRLLYPDLSAVDMFITAQLVHLDTAERRVIVASAGHCPLLAAEAVRVTPHSPDGMPLGVKPDTAFADARVALTNSTRLLLYSDGVTDALDVPGSALGPQRLADLFGKASPANSSAEEIKLDLVAELDRRQSAVSLKDDQTFIVVSAHS